MAQNDEFRIVASLNITDSAKRISDDIQSQLVPMVDAKNALQLTASLNETATVAKIQGQLDKMSAQNMTINIGANVSNTQAQMSQIKNQVQSQLTDIQGVVNNSAVNIASTINNAIKTSTKSISIDPNAIQQMTDYFMTSFDLMEKSKDGTIAVKNEVSSLMEQFAKVLTTGDIKRIEEVEQKLLKVADAYGKISTNIEALNRINTIRESYDGIGGNIMNLYRDDYISAYGTANEVRKTFDSVFGIGKWNWGRGSEINGNYLQSDPLGIADSSIPEQLITYCNAIIDAKSQLKQKVVDSLSDQSLDQIFQRLQEISGIKFPDASQFTQQMETLKASVKDAYGNIKISYPTYDELAKTYGTDTVNAFMDSLAGSSKQWQIVESSTNATIKSVEQYNSILSQSQAIQKAHSNELMNYSTNATQQMSDVTASASTVENAITQVQNATTQTVSSLSPIQTQYRTTFENIANVVKIAEDEFRRFGEVSSVSNKPAFTENGIEYYKDFTIQVKAATGEVQKFKYEMQTDENTGNIFYQLQNINEADAGIKKLTDAIEKAKAQAQKLMASFDNKSQGKFVNLEVYQNAKKALESITDFDSISRFNNAMAELETHYQNIISHTRSSNKSLNPFINAINDMAGIDEQIKRIKLSAEGLQGKSKSLIGSLGSLDGMAERVRKYAIGTEEWAVAYERLKNKIAEVTSQIKTLKLEQKTNNSFYQKQQSMYSVIEQRMKQINALKKQQISSDTETSKIIQEQIDTYTRQINSVKANMVKYGYQDTDLDKRLESLRKELDYNLRIAQSKAQQKADTQNQRDIEQTIQQVNNYAISIENAIKRLNNLKTSSVFTNNTGNADIQNQISQINQLITKFTEAQTVINGMKSTGTIDSTQFANLTNVMTDLNTKFREVTSSANALQTQLKQTNGQDIQSGKIKVLISQLEAFAVANSKAMKSNKLLSSGKTVSQEWNAMMSQLKAGADPTLTRQIANNFRVVRNEVKALGLEGGTVLQTLWKNVKKFSSWMGITMITASIAREVRGLFKDVYELDTALVDLRKTFKGAASDLEEFYYESNDIAKQLGVTTKEVISQASAWSRLGFNTKETAIEMSKMSSIFASISPDMNTDEATDGLLSIIKAFDVDVNDVLDGVISKVNKVGNEFGTSNGEIVNMLTRSSSAMKEANNTLEETIALETAAVEITRDAESVGTAFKTLSMRLRGYDESTEEYSNDVEVLSGKIADLTKTASTPGGISLFTDSSKTTYKSTVQLLREISAIYDDLSDKTQAELLEVLAGRRLPVYIVICA